MPSSDDTIGLFPLRLVLLPGEILPLHIFEERYKTLIGECRATDSVFGVLLAALWLGEELHWGHLLGGATIVAGLVLGLSRQVKR